MTNHAHDALPAALLDSWDSNNTILVNLLQAIGGVTWDVWMSKASAYCTRVR